MFNATGKMAIPRILHTATLLPDGRVLIAGGWQVSGSGGEIVSSKILTSAELYDPKTDTFSATGSMASPRVNCTATLLSDGRVLIAGGGNDNGALSSAEIYNPRTGTFSATGLMSSARDNPTAVRLLDGRVLIVGGYDNSGNARDLSSAELYDPKTGKFAGTGSMVNARSYFTATLLTDGRVLVAGGMQGPAGTAELYDPMTGRFTPIGYMTEHWRAGQTATLLSDGRVLIAGGFGRDGYLASAEIYQP
jgi:WD40 repeat protein